MTLPDLVGIAGVTCYQIAYAGLQLGRLQRTDGRYIALNILGPVCLLFSLVFHFNLAAFVAQVLWLALTTLGLVRIAIAKRTPVPHPAQLARAGETVAAARTEQAAKNNRSRPSAQARNKGSRRTPTTPPQ